MRDRSASVNSATTPTDRRGSDDARPSGPGEDVGGARGAGPRLDPWDPTRLPRHHPRLVRIRTHPPCGPLRAFTWPVLRGRGAKPLGLEFYIGLPASVDRDRVAHLHGFSKAEMLLHLRSSEVLPPRCWSCASWRARIGCWARARMSRTCAANLGGRSLRKRPKAPLDGRVVAGL